MTRRRIENEKRRINQERLPLRQTGPPAFEGQLRGRDKWAHQSFRTRIDLPRNYPARPPGTEIIM